MRSIVGVSFAFFPITPCLIHSDYAVCHYLGGVLPRFPSISAVPQITTRLISVPFADGYSGDACSSILSHVRVLDEIDNRWPHAAKEISAHDLQKYGCWAHPRNPTHTLRNAHMNGIHLSSANTVSQRIEEKKRDERAHVKAPRLVQADQYIRQYRRTQYRTSQPEHDKS